MSYSDEAAKVLEQFNDCIDWDGGWDDRDKAIRSIAAFGRRCAEAMREECAKVATSFGGVAHRYTADEIAQAMRRVEIK